MSKVNTYAKYCAVVLISCTVLSCNVLEKAPGSDVTEDTIFETQKDFESFLLGTYAFGLHSYYPYYNRAQDNGTKNPNPAMGITSCMTDESEAAASFMPANQWNSAAITKGSITSQEDTRWELRWEALRRANIIIERIPATSFSDIDKKHYMGEALFLRALNHFELFKRYGGMPIVDKRLDVSDDWNLPRKSVEEMVEFMVADCDNAADCLSDAIYTELQRGRITKSACLALKAKILLFAASPLFNTAEPYLPSDHPELICYGDYSLQRWGRAAEAAREALASCENEGFSILDNNDPENDYRKLWETFDNVEVILAEKFTNANLGTWQFPWTVLLPYGYSYMGQIWGGAGVCVTHNFIAKYDKMDGTKPDWKAPGVVGDDIMAIYASLDPRFRQTVVYNGSAWNSDWTDSQLYEGCKGTSPSAVCNLTGTLLHKTIPRQLGEKGNNRLASNGILFRVGELYLDLAEAVNEFEGPTDEVYNAMHVIRDRAGMPDFPAGLSQEQMRARIKNERDIELSFEDHRLWDIRRWMDAEKEGVMKGNIYRENVQKGTGAGLSQKCEYSIEVLEVRSFNRNMYLHPIPEKEENKGYMVQNPGW